MFLVVLSVISQAMAINCTNDSRAKALLCDPQTSGGLLLAVAPGSEDEIAEIAKHHNIELQAIGELFEQDGSALIEVC